MSPRRPRHNDVSPWLPAVAAGLVLVLVLGIGVFVGGNGTNVDADEATSVGVPPPPTSPQSTATTATPSTPATTTGPPTAVVAPLAGPLAPGSFGDDAVAEGSISTGAPVTASSAPRRRAPRSCGRLSSDPRLDDRFCDRAAGPESRFSG